MSALKATRGVDTHAHVFSAAAPAVPGARYRPEYAAELSAWRALWKKFGITHGVVVQPSFFGSDNREMLDTVSSDRTHLRGVAVVPPIVDDATLDRFHGDGVRAIRLNLRGARDYAEYSSAAWRSLYTRVHSRGWHIECYVDPGRMAQIAPAFDSVPTAVLFDHFGMPGRDRTTADATFRAVERLARDREVWCKFSAPYRLESPDPKSHAQRWLETVGPGRIVWGSDWPFTGFEGDADYASCFKRFGDWIEAKLAPAILWDNAARLYGFE